jgi:hypothetical protein
MTNNATHTDASWDDLNATRGKSNMWVELKPIDPAVHDRIVIKVIELTPFRRHEDLEVTGMDTDGGWHTLRGTCGAYRREVVDLRRV